MGTNGTDIAAPPDRTPLRKRVLDSRPADREYERSLSEPDPALTDEDFALAPLVDKIAWGIARGLVVAVKELEQHIATETRKVGDTVDHRLDLFQVALDDLSKFVGEQRGTNAAVQGQLQELTQGLRTAETREAADVEALRKEAQESSTSISQRIDAATASLQESDARQAADLAALQKETKTSAQSLSERIDGLSKELGVQQEDIAAIKGLVSTFSSRVDALAERLDRQAEAVRSMCTAYSQRETELEQLVDGLARLRAFPTPLPTNGL
jgi:chromosome segregation ATPase